MIGLIDKVTSYRDRFVESDADRVLMDEIIAEITRLRKLEPDLAEARMIVRRLTEILD